MPTIDSLDDLAKLVLRDPDVCVRFSKGPEADGGHTSVDYESGLELPGLSANPLKPEDWWTRDLRDWLARQICHYVHLKEEDEDRFAWVIAGAVAGYGPDREPLLDPWRAVARLSKDLVQEARRRYEERFEVGRDSAAD